MVVVFAIFAVLLGICGGGLIVMGIVMLAEGTGAGVVGIICGLPVTYGTYLFGRAAARVHRELRVHPPDEKQQESRRRSVRGVLGYTAAMIVGAVALPAPGAVRVLMAVSALLVMPLILARDFEPGKKRKPPS